MRNRAGVLVLAIIGAALAAPVMAQQTAAILVPHVEPYPQSEPARSNKVTFVRVDKSERRMWLMAGDRVIRSYKVSLGGNPVGQKLQEGDQKTPEGMYRIAWRNPTSVAYRSMYISYPNPDDRARSKRAGVSPGGHIMIHGQHNGIGWLAPIAQLLDWTNGCIAVTNAEMDEIIELVEPGTRIAIHP